MNENALTSEDVARALRELPSPPDAWVAAASLQPQIREWLRELDEAGVPDSRLDSELEALIQAELVRVAGNVVGENLTSEVRRLARESSM